VKSPISTIQDHLLIAGLELKHLKGVADSIPQYQKRSRIEISVKLFDMFRTAGHHPWNDFVTGDEKSFSLETDHEHFGVNMGISDL
jgi:hypothetical protein